MAPHSLADERASFSSQPAYEMRRRMSKIEETQNWAGLSLTVRPSLFLPSFNQFILTPPSPCLSESPS